MGDDEMAANFKRASEIAEKVPKHLQEAAFNRALDMLFNHPPPRKVSIGQPKGPKRSPARPSKKVSARSLVPTVEIPTSDVFYSKLASESGVSEPDLRDVIRLASDGVVQVTPPTKDLGASISQQAKTVIALVAGARSRGLGEDPVSLEAVRGEADRKHCYQVRKFVTDHLGSFKGFRAGAKGEILLTSKWTEDFKAAVERALGRTPTKA